MSRINVIRNSPYYLSVSIGNAEYVAFTRLTTGVVYELRRIVERSDNSTTRRIDIHSKPSFRTIAILAACVGH